MADCQCSWRQASWGAQRPSRYWMERKGMRMPLLTTLPSSVIPPHSLPYPGPPTPSQSYSEVVYGVQGQGRLKLLTNKASGCLVDTALHIIYVPQLHKWLRTDCKFSWPSVENMSSQGMGKQASALTKTLDPSWVWLGGEGAPKTVDSFIFLDFILLASVSSSSSNDLFKVRRCLLKWP